MQTHNALRIKVPSGVMQERAAAEAFMAGVRQAYPEVAASVRTTQLAHRLLAHKARFVEELSRTGALSSFHLGSTWVAVRTFTTSQC